MATKPGPPGVEVWLLIALPCLVFLGGLMSLDFVPEWRANHFYVEGRCVLLDKRLVEYPPSGKAMNSTYRPECLLRYTVAGREYQTWAYKATRTSSALRWPKERILESFTVGQEYPCWYDPADPSQVVLVRGYSWLSNSPLLVLFGVLAFFTVRGIYRSVRAARGAADEASRVGSEPGPAAHQGSARRYERERRPRR
jgi:hypothetical protein